MSDHSLALPATSSTSRCLTPTTSAPSTSHALVTVTAPRWVQFKTLHHVQFHRCNPSHAAIQSAVWREKVLLFARQQPRRGPNPYPYYNPNPNPSPLSPQNAQYCLAIGLPNAGARCKFSACVPLAGSRVSHSSRAACTDKITCPLPSCPCRQGGRDPVRGPLHPHPRPEPGLHAPSQLCECVTWLWRRCSPLCTVIVWLPARSLAKQCCL